MFSLSVFGIFLYCYYVATFLASYGYWNDASPIIGSLGGILLKTDREWNGYTLCVDASIPLVVWEVVFECIWMSMIVS